MARYSAGFQKTPAPTSGTLISQLRTPSTRDIRVWEVGIFVTSAVAPTVGLVRLATVGATFTSVTPTADDTSSGAAQTICDTAATTAPTIATTYLRRVALPATIGAGIIWTFPVGLVVPISSGVALWSITAGSTFEGYWTFDE